MSMTRSARARIGELKSQDAVLKRRLARDGDAGRTHVTVETPTRRHRAERKPSPSARKTGSPGAATISYASSATSRRFPTRSRPNR